MKRRAAFKTDRSGLTPRDRHVRICKIARLIQQGRTDYDALLKRGYGKGEITQARVMLGLHQPLDGARDQQPQENAGRQ